ncbi:hypothetical protein DRQ32_11540 [bacterium]|nr:MAG: hypothetical protein DRQ32_11540 [bacterium]
MSKQCYQPGEFERLLNLPDDHEDRRHLESCVACQAEMSLYRSFMGQEPVPAGADLADANAKLGDFLEREIGGAGETFADRALSDARKRWDLRRWTPVLLAACLVCVAMYLRFDDGTRMDSPSGVARDMSLETPGLVTSESAATSGFMLNWNGPAEADSYELVVMDTAMTEIERITGDPSGTHLLSSEEHPWLQGSGPFFWYAVALQDGDEIARSTVRALEPSP